MFFTKHYSPTDNMYRKKYLYNTKTVPSKAYLPTGAFPLHPSRTDMLAS